MHLNVVFRHVTYAAVRSVSTSMCVKEEYTSQIICKDKIRQLLDKITITGKILRDRQHICFHAIFWLESRYFMIT